MVFSVKVRGRVIVIVLLRSCGHGDTPPPLRDDEDSENVGLRRTRRMQCRDDGVEYTSVEV